MASRSGAKAPLAFVLLTFSAACLLAVLVTCLPRGEISSATARSENGASPRSDANSGNASGEQKADEIVQPVQPVEPVQPERLSLQPVTTPAARPEKPEKGVMAVIIDDAGYSLEDLQPFLDFPAPIAIAVLPNLPLSAETARRVKSAGKTLLLHLPMEPLNGEDPGPGALRTEQPDAEIERLLAAAFSTVPGAEGLNNHMGSKATADERIMNVVFAVLAGEGKYFVDSRTTPGTVAARVADRYSVPFLQRDVFIDNERDRVDIAARIIEGAADARRRGMAILIGHVHTPQILDILKENMTAFQETGVRLADLSEMFRSGKEPRR
jgi:hypothetical protein